MYPFYLGIDLHLKSSYVVLINAEGVIIDKRQMRNQELGGYLKEHVPTETYAVMEATRNWPYFYDLLEGHVDRVELAHAKEVRSIATAAVKTDQIDATVLANLARMNYVPIAYAATKEIRDLRQHMRYREWLVDERRRLKNRVHAVLAGYNLASPVTDLFGRAGREWLADVMETELRSPAVVVMRKMLELIDRLDEQIKELGKAIPIPKGFGFDIDVLTSMPGIGQLLAATILAEIGNIQRFSSPKALCSWAGLTPRVHQSGSVLRHGRITKEGSRYLRSAMVCAAITAIRVSPRWSRVYERIARRSGWRSAKVAVGRKMLSVIYFMLKRGERYQEEYEQRPRVSQGA